MYIHVFAEVDILLVRPRIVNSCQCGQNWKTYCETLSTLLALASHNHFVICSLFIIADEKVCLYDTLDSQTFTCNVLRQTTAANGNALLTQDERRCTGSMETILLRKENRK